jgi:hypothetical protein
VRYLLEGNIIYLENLSGEESKERNPAQMCKGTSCGFEYLCKKIKVRHIPLVFWVNSSNRLFPFQQVAKYSEYATMSNSNGQGTDLLFPLWLKSLGNKSQSVSNKTKQKCVINPTCI